MYICNSCGKLYAKWQGKCDQCGRWNSIEESKEIGKNNLEKRVSSISLKKLLTTRKPLKRTSSGVKVLDKIIGGGFVKGQALLIAGEPGIGKSTVALQVASESGLSCLYVSGEETAEQIADRASRIVKEPKLIKISNTTDTDAVVYHIANLKPQLVIIDSIQTMFISDVAGFLGSLTQVKESAYRLVNVAKKASHILLILGQITKSGVIAGPKTLEHIVDTVIYLEGEKGGDLRIARCNKNRFGRAGIISVFKMTPTGLQEVEDPSSAFLSTAAEPQVGVARTIALEGQLPLGVEIQSLSSFSAFSLPRRVARGVDINKLLIILGIVEKHTKIAFSKQDIYVNVAGGVSVKEPGIDLAIAASLISSSLEKPLPPDTFYIGELELSGKIRVANGNSERIKISERCGAEKIFVAKLGTETHTKKRMSTLKNIRVIEVTDINDLIQKIQLNK